MARVTEKRFRLTVLLAWSLQLVACGIFLSGCGGKAEGLLTLKRLGDSQKEIGRYLERQEKLFDKLVEDIKNRKLELGVSKRRIISIYGEPVLSKQPEGSLEKVFLYRYPTKYFSSDKVYLYFDESGELSSWKYVPRGPAEE